MNVEPPRKGRRTALAETAAAFSQKGRRPMMGRPDQTGAASVGTPGPPGCCSSRRDARFKRIEVKTRSSESIGRAKKRKSGSMADNEEC